jgi:uncharacterized protein (DUF1800 family)
MGEADQPTQINRRAVLKLGSSVPALAAVAAVTPPPRDLPPALQESAVRQAARVVPPPPLPNLAIIALNRMAFGYSVPDYLAFQSLGSTPQERLVNYIEQQLYPYQIDDSVCQARLAAASFQTLDKSLAQLWSDHVVNNNQGYSFRYLPYEETVRAAFIRAVYSKRQLLETLVDFWHNHFNVHGEHYYVAPAFSYYDREIIRANAFGNFRQMLEAVAKSTPMLYYLDNYINQVGGFNENFARELLELHTLGAHSYYGTGDPFDVPVDENGVKVGYVDNDVYEAARCFTGWRVDYSSWEQGVGESGTFLYYDAWHDRANKFFMGDYFPSDQPAMQDGLDVLDRIAAHPGTAYTIASKLCRRFISDDPPETLVAQAAQTFLDHTTSSDQIRRVLRTILASDEFQATWGEKIKRPFEAAAAILRATQAEFSPSDEFLWDFERMGQALFGRPSPDGYPDRKEVWSSTNSMLQRWRLANRLIENSLDDISLDTLSQTPAHIRTPNGLGDFWINRVLGRPLHPAENRAEIVAFLAQGRNPDFDLTTEQFEERVPRMVALLLMTPDFQLR